MRHVWDTYDSGDDGDDDHDDDMKRATRTRIKKNSFCVYFSPRAFYFLLLFFNHIEDFFFSFISVYSFATAQSMRILYYTLYIDIRFI